MSLAVTGPRASRASRRLRSGARHRVIAALRSPEAAIYTAATRPGLRPARHWRSSSASRLAEPDPDPRRRPRREQGTPDELGLAHDAVMAKSLSLFHDLSPGSSVSSSGAGTSRATRHSHPALTVLASAAGPSTSALLIGARSGLGLATTWCPWSSTSAWTSCSYYRLRSDRRRRPSWSVALIVRDVLPLVQVRSMIHMSPFGRGPGWVAVSSVLCSGCSRSSPARRGDRRTLSRQSAVAVGALGYSACCGVDDAWSRSTPSGPCSVPLDRLADEPDLALRRPPVA